MRQSSSFGGPVSVALESDLRAAVQRSGVVVWLDVHNHYSSFVDRLAAARAAGALPYEVRSFRGSYLAWMLSLEGVASGVEKVPLVIHLPGFTEESVTHTPAFEMYAAGTRHKKALDTIVTEAAAGRIRPEVIAAFKAQPGLTLEDADAWLAAQLDADAGGIAAQLLSMTPLAFVQDLLTGGAVSGRLRQEGVVPAVWERLSAWLGLPATWRDATIPAVPRPEDVAFAASGWTLCVEYVADLNRPAVSPLLQPVASLPPALVATCRSIAANLRAQHTEFYVRTADATEALLGDEVETARPADLGKTDTFRFEEDQVLAGALAALGTGDWSAALEWAEPRTDGDAAAPAFWLTRDPSRKTVWQLVHAAAHLGAMLEKAGPHLPPRTSVDAAVDDYVERGALVDRAHRHLEQRRAALLYPQLPEFETLRTRLDALRQAWRVWADAWARDFNAVCRAHGFLPTSARQQRTLFDDVVRPLTTDGGATAYFVIDALRFEMGEELFGYLGDTPATTAHLKARLAELPTVTEVGMNVLAPVSTNGRLTPALSSDDRGRITGFKAAEFRVSDPESRRRAMHDRVGGTSCPWLTLDEVVSRDSASLKRAIAQARLVVVHTREIDTAGEAGIGPAVFDQLLQRLRAAWHLLREAGIRRFVFTGDHGFLLLDPATATAQTQGRRVDPKRRHVFSPVAADHTGEVRVALADLGYEGLTGHVMCPDSTAVFDTGGATPTFAHGGNSLQERVIPVLTVVHRAAAGGSTVRYGVTATVGEPVAGMHCLSAKVEVIVQGTLDFGGAREVDLSVRALDASSVQVELCQTRGKARIAGSVVQATVGETFELFFRLAGPSDARVQIEIFHPGGIAEVGACVPDARYTVAGDSTRRTSTAPARGGDGTVPGRWLEDLPGGGIRQVFEHLAAHGAVTESEAAAMLGGARGLRRFALQFDALAAKAPWSVRIDVIGGVKRYVREGSHE